MSTYTSGHTSRGILSGQTAAGSNQATALALPGRGDWLVEFTSVPSGAGALLPPVILPMRFEISNAGTNTLSVYPQSGGQIDANGTNDAATIAAGKAAMYEAVSLAQWYTISATSGSGTVTSVTFTGDGTVLSSSPSSAVTTTGTLTAALATQSANKLLAGPTTGSAAGPTFRSLVAADLPTVPNTSLQNSSVTVTAGPGLSGGGAVSLGGSETVSLAIFNPTAVKTGTYTASPNDLVVCDCSGGSFTVTLPAAPADKTVIGVKLVNVGSGSNSVTVACGGLDVIDKAGGSTTTSLTVTNQVRFFQYFFSSGIWYIVAADNSTGGYVAGQNVTITTSAGQRSINASGATTLGAVLAVRANNLIM
jgi:hypothetical protein